MMEYKVYEVLDNGNALNVGDEVALVENGACTKNIKKEIIEVRGRTKVIGLTFEDFKKITLEKVRTDNYLNKVEFWEDNVLHSEFYENGDSSYYSSTIYFIEECRENNHYIKKYRYSYSCETLYEDGYEVIDTVVLRKISLLEGLISKSNARYLYGTLKKFQECAAKIE
jgi:hypothetical protein